MNCNIFDDTICAPATVPGTGAITIIRVSGEHALAAADQIIKCRSGNISGSKGYTIKFGTVYSECSELIDEVLVSVFKAPHSYTGEDSVEISCHSSSYIVSEIIGLLHKAGVRSAEPGEFTRRAFINGKMDLAQAEAVADVIAAQNAAAHRIAFNQLKGGFSSELKQMRSSLLEIVSLMELELDFSEEEVEFADRSRLKELVDGTLNHIKSLIDSFKTGNAIKNGVPVAIAGPTNAGKSTLLNALLGEERAIVSDIHGTTRDTIEETINVEGVLFRLIDTAGLRQTDEVIEKIGIERTMDKIGHASVILAMADVSRDTAELSSNLTSILEKVDFGEQIVFILLNKVDTLDDNIFVNKLNYLVSFLENQEYNSIVYKDDCSYDTTVSKGDKKRTIRLIPISAKSGAGLPLLKSMLSASQKNLLSEGTTLVTNERHVQALSDAHTSLTRVRSGLDTTLPTDLVAQDLREALHHLGTITGDITTDEVLGNIFSHFCIGK